MSDGSSFSFQLAIFPDGSLDSSVVTTVWVGVSVAVLCNLRFGWALSGLVVPGYIVPLLVMKPCSALVVFLEGILAYGIVWFFSEYLSRYGHWSNLFGRDRFFAIVLASIFVRTVFDGFLLPPLASYLSRYVLGHYEFADDLHSFGLIIVALIANQFWKTGIRRGLPPLIVTVGTTYLIVRYPLMYLTNFSIVSLEFMYEDISGSFVASPKAYIVLVTTAYIASRLNLIYAWEFNGIVLPALIALQWYEPVKVVTSLAEAWIVYWLAAGVIKLPALKEMCIERGRKILLFFNVSFAYKLAVGHVASWWFPDIQATDCFGFGYLLPSLLAVRMHEKNIPERLTRTTLQASLVGVFVATIVGFGLTLLPLDPLVSFAVKDAHAGARTSPVTEADLVAQLRSDKIEMYRARSDAKPAVPSQIELDLFTSGLRRLRRYLRSGDPLRLVEARSLLRPLEFDISEVEPRTFYISEFRPGRNRGVFVVNGESQSGPLIEVPYPLEEWATLEAGAYLFRLFGGRSLAIAPASPDGDVVGARDPLHDRRTYFHCFHRVFGGRDVVQVRAQPHPAENDVIARGAHFPGATQEFREPSRVWVRGRIPDPVRLVTLDALCDDLAVVWSVPRARNVQRDTTRGSFVEMFFSRDDLRGLLARHFLRVDGAGAPGEFPARFLRDLEGGDVTIGEWLVSRRAAIAERGSNRYVPPVAEELLFVDQEVLRPLVAVVWRSRAGHLPDSELRREVHAISAAARSVGYEVVIHDDAATGGRFLILTERPETLHRRHWGDYVFRLDASDRFVVEIPRPDYERNTLEYGASIFDKLDAAFLLLAGAHARANTDQSSDVVDSANPASLFNLANQVILRESAGEPLVVVQVRAFGHRSGAVQPRADALLAFADGLTRDEGISPGERRLRDTIVADGLEIAYVDGSRSTAGYEAHGSLQAYYLSHTRGNRFVAVWLSPYNRFGYETDSPSALELQVFRALGIETERIELDGMIARARLAPPLREVPAELRDGIERFLRTRDVNALRRIQLLRPSFSLRRVVDADTSRVFLLVFDGSDLVPLITRLAMRRLAAVRAGDVTEWRTTLPLRKDRVKEYVESTATFLLIEESEP